MPTAVAAAFGAAMASMYAAPELQADIIDLTFTPNINSYNPGPGYFIVPILIDQVGANFSQFNDFFGKTLVQGSLTGVQLVNASSTLNAGTFMGAPFIAAGNGFSAAATGTAFVGFSFNGNVGWFSLNLGGPGGAITYLGGEYGSMGESVHVGGTSPAVPETGSTLALAGLSLLALGAVGVRLNRAR